jgi:hypothetical protein
LNPKNHKRDAKNKNMLGMDSGNKVEKILDVDENIFFTSMKKEVNLSILHQKEDKDMKKNFHNRIQVKNTKVDSLLNSGSQANLIKNNLVSNIGLDIHDHLSPYPLGWVNKDGNIRVII